MIKTLIGVPGADEGLNIARTAVRGALASRHNGMPTHASTRRIVETFMQVPGERKLACASAPSSMAFNDF
jgi:hypothetical protein